MGTKKKTSTGPLQCETRRRATCFLLLLSAMTLVTTEAVAVRDPAPLDMYDMAQILDTSSLDPHLLWEELSPEGVLIRGLDYFAGGWAGIHRQDWEAWIASGYQGNPPSPDPYPWTVQGLLYVPPGYDWSAGYGLVAQTSSSNNDLGEGFWTEYGVETTLALGAPVLLIDTPPQDVIGHYGWGDDEGRARALVGRGGEVGQRLPVHDHVQTAWPEIDQTGGQDSRETRPPHRWTQLSGPPVPNPGNDARGTSARTGDGSG
ncbi:MAG: hypothetical protein QGG33_01560 [Candidatus Krumholzibacteria bacterium]|jgi:hypothetical protein|nr:hypothetical protein [Candidatus Krumholzibacteria bacterium]MDP7022453.1 hypothetical protein [Candidatus Krumholzibacteria bacterium]